MIRYHTTPDILCQIVMCLGIFIIGCKSPAEEVRDLSSYYYPVNDLSAEGTLYTYKNMQDTLADKEMWRHRKKGDGLVESINYDFKGDVVQRQFDHIVTNGVLIDSLILYFEDSFGITRQQKVKVLTPHRFPFDPGDSTKVWLTHLEWWQPEDSVHIVLERRRRFIGPVSWEFEGKKIPAVKFRTEDKFETEEVGWTSSAWTGVEIYAKNIGLVYYKRNISDQLSLEFQLETRK
jgi:hypothetical protein